MTIKDFIQKKDYDYVSYRVTLPEGNKLLKHYPGISLIDTDYATFAGFFKTRNGNIIPLDYSIYDSSEEVLEYEEWSQPKDNITNGLTILVKGEWYSEDEELRITDEMYSVVMKSDDMDDMKIGLATTEEKAKKMVAAASTVGGFEDYEFVIKPVKVNLLRINGEEIKF